MAVTGLELQVREVVLAGRAFGDAAAYEKISGIVRFVFDPTHPAHLASADIELAPRNAGGRVD